MERLKLIGWAKNEQILAAADYLNKAADILNLRGWIQGRVQNEAGDVCAIGALCHVAAVDDQPLPTVAFDSTEIIAQGVFYRVAGVNISVYNDAEGRTKAEVQAKMRWVAAEAIREVQAWQAKQPPAQS